MKEIDIKIALLKYLISRHPKGIVGAEVSYLFGARRADMIMIYNNAITVFEIKSENDSINRLKGQISDYKDFFDFCYVVGESSNIQSINEVVSKSVGIMCVEGNQVKLIRGAHLFKAQKKITLASVFGVDKLKSMVGRKKNVSQVDLANIVAKKLTLNELKKEVREYLLEQYRARFEILLSEISQEITEDDLQTITQKVPIEFKFS